MRRVSIVSMMRGVSIVAIGLAALRNADEFWAGVMLLLTFGILGTALLATVHSRRSDRAWWLGFTTFAAGYLALTFGPWLSETLSPRLGTSRLLGLVSDAIAGPFYPGPTTSEHLGERFRELSLSLQGLRSDPGVAPQTITNTEQELFRCKRMLILRGSPLAAGINLSPDESAKMRLQLAFPGPSNRDDFARVGHCLFALLAGLIGAVVSCRVYRKAGEGPH